jgi:hypothetical protein
MLGIIWYPKRIHSELLIGDQIRYYVGNKDKYNLQKTMKDLLFDAKSSDFVIIRLPSDHLTIDEIENAIEQTNISRYNTCMGTVAFLVDRLCRIKIPPLIRTSPELSYLYFLLRSSTYKDVKIEYVRITKKEAILQALKNGGVSLDCIWIFYKIFNSINKGVT